MPVIGDIIFKFMFPRKEKTMENLKLTGVDKITLTDSLSAPLLSFKLSLTENTVIPTENTLQILVSQGSDVKNYRFDLPQKLAVGDIFQIEPTFENSKVTMKTFIERNHQKSYLETQRIDLWEGTNTIETNYQNVTLEIAYPKNIEAIKYFFLNAFADTLEKESQITFDDLYFKDAFTEEDEKLNLEVNRLKIDCLTSNNNTFSLDEFGNLNVNSITSREKEPTQTLTTLNDLTINSLRSKNNKFGLDSEGNLMIQSLTCQNAVAPDFNKIYPIGSIYMTVNANNPKTIFGGTWENIAKGRTLVGVDTSQTEFNTAKKIGGSKTVTLTEAQIPSHKHGMGITPTGSYGSGYGINISGGYQDRVTVTSGDPEQLITKPVGSNGAHTNLQPYFTCYIWQRTA